MPSEKKDFLVKPESPLVLVSVGVLAEVVTNLIREGRSHVCIGIGHAVQLDAPKDYLVCMSGSDATGRAEGALHGLQAMRVSEITTEQRPMVLQ